MRSIHDMAAAEAEAVRFVLMDIDDTLTTDGKLTADSYAALWELKAAGLKVIPITGRPAGWCDLIAREWPVDGVVGENGAFVFWEAEGRRLRAITPTPAPFGTTRLPLPGPLRARRKKCPAAGLPATSSPGSTTSRSTSQRRNPSSPSPMP